MGNLHAQVTFKLRHKTKSNDKVLDESAELFVKLQAVQEQIGKSPPADNLALHLLTCLWQADCHVP